MKIVVAAVWLGALLGCEKPVFDDRIGVAGVATADGSFAGTFALKAVLTDQADTALGTILSGGMTFYLVTTTHDGDGTYQATYDICDVINFETAGLTTVIPPDTLASLPSFSSTITIDHGTGAMSLDVYREHWAVADLPANEDLPQDPTDPRFFDVEGDDKPGATVVTSGLVSGEVYVAQRKTVSTSGVVRDDDSAVGLCTHRKEGIVLDATNDFLKTESPRRPHEDPKRSWFVLTRLEDNADCASVLAAKDDGRLPVRPPFETD
jgi:hypothetical protein